MDLSSVVMSYTGLRQSRVEQSNVVELLGGKALCRLPRTSSAAILSEDLASGVEQSNVVDLLGGKALCRLPRTCSPCQVARVIDLSKNEAVRPKTLNKCSSVSDAH